MKGYKKVLLGIFLVLASYLPVGYFLHLIVFPETRPDLETYFEPGDIIDSEVGGTKPSSLFSKGAKFSGCATGKAFGI